MSIPNEDGEGRCVECQKPVGDHTLSRSPLLFQRYQSRTSRTDSRGEAHLNCQAPTPMRDTVERAAQAVGPTARAELIKQLGRIDDQDCWELAGILISRHTVTAQERARCYAAAYAKTGDHQTAHAIHQVWLADRADRDLVNIPPPPIPPVPVSQVVRPWPELDE